MAPVNCELPPLLIASLEFINERWHEELFLICIVTSHGWLIGIDDVLIIISQ